MKRVGTITSAIGFIFIGVWMILRNIDQAFSIEFFKWWPIIIILFGIEIIFLVGKKGKGEKVGFNFLVIPLVIVFLGINVFVGITSNIGKSLGFFNDGVKINLKDFKNFKDFNVEYGNSKEIKYKKTLDQLGNKLSFNTQNGEIKFKKSTDGKIKFDLTIYVDKNLDMNSYDKKEIYSNEEIRFDINEGYVKGVKGDIYIPEGYRAIIDINNVKLESEDTLANVEWNIKSNNGLIDISGGKSLDVSMSNGKIDGENIKSSKVKMNNGTVYFQGDLQQGNIQVDNGKVQIENKICKDINVAVNMGVAEIKTVDENLNVNLDVSQGKCSLNDDSRVNSGIVKTLGNGSGKLNMKVKIGSLKVSNQEW